MIGGWRVLVLGLAVAGAAACSADPAGPATDPTPGATIDDPRARYAGCTASATGNWEPGFDDWSETRIYDEHGSLVDRDYDGGSPERVFRQTWQRRPDGFYERYELDLGSDGSVDEWETYVWKGDDVRSWEHDLDGDDRVDERSEFDSADGLISEERLDEDANGSFDTKFVFEYSDAGILERITRNDGLDDRLEWLAQYTYVDDTELVESIREDEGLDGVFDRWEENEYDELGRMVSSITFDAFEALSDVAWTWEYVDDNGTGGDDLADLGTYETGSLGEIVDSADWGVSYDSAGRELQRLWYYAAGQTLTMSTTWDCP